MPIVLRNKGMKYEAVFARCRCVDSVAFRSCLGSRPRQASRACSLWAGRGILQLDRMLCRRQWRGVLGSERLVQSSVRGQRFRRETASGGLGGVQVGCNYQIGQWVLGVQGDWDWISATSSTANIAFPFFTDQPDTKSLASVTGRVGYAWGRFLLYGKGGGAGLRSDFSLQTAGAVFSVSETRSGWTVGVGGEYAFLDWLTGFIEYDHYGFRDDNGVSFGCGALCPIGTVAAFPINIRTDVDVVKAGLNLKLAPPHDGNARPVISRHPT